MSNRIRETIAVYKGKARKVPDRIRSTQSAASFFCKVIPNSPQESFVVLLLDAKARPMGWTEVSRGGLASAQVEIASVFRTAIITGALQVMVGHNHPSGDPSPSPDDLELVSSLKEAGTILGIRVLDSLIIVHDDPTDYFSWVEAGLIKNGGES